MAETSGFEKKRDYAQYFTMGMSLLYALYWAVLSIFNTRQTHAIKITGDVLLTLLVAGGVLMGLLYAIKSSKK